MFQAFLIVSREAAELLLIVMALRQWARQTGRRGLGPWIVAGLVLGLGATAGIVATLPASGLNEWLDIGLRCVFGLSVALLSCGTMASMTGIGRHARSLLDDWLSQGGASAPVMAFVAFTTLREALEAALLLRFVATGSAPQDVAWGIALSLAACALLAAAWQALAASRHTQTAFRLTAVLLFVLGMQMLLEAVADLLLRGVAGPQLTPLGHALQPYVEQGERYWLSSAALAIVPVAVWLRAWWRQAGTAPSR